MAKKMHLGAVLMFGPTHTGIGAWRTPDYPLDHDYAEPEVWQELARIFERGKYDMAFFADGLGTFEDPPDSVMQYSVQWPIHDPMLLLPYMASVTDKLGLVATFTTSYEHPYLNARRFATLNHLTKGRVGWNIVTSAYHSEALNFGVEIASHDERYERGDEFVDVCKALWSSWEADAIVADRASGSWAEPAKVRPIDHKGKYFASRGPLNVKPSRFGPPVLAAAGQSPRGLDSCGRNADVVFAIQWNPAAMRPHRDRLHERARAHGREAPPILWGVKVFVAPTEQEALAKQRALLDAVPEAAARRMFQLSSGVDVTNVPWDSPVRAVKADVGSHGLLAALTENVGPDVTVGEAATMSACGLAPHVVGTPGQVADRLEELFEGAGGDGFVFMTDYSPAEAASVVDLLIPELQRRGRFRQDYSGMTFRHHLQEY